MSHVPTPETKTSFNRWRIALQNKLCEHLPYIRRKRHRKLVALLKAQADAASDRLLSLPSPATYAALTQKIFLSDHAVNELCLFVSFAPTPHLKPYVIDHINALLNEGIAVVLVINSPLMAEQLELPEELAARLSGCLVRENTGFDFAAWAHAYSLLDATLVKDRLYLVNDSIIGPLELATYRKIIARIRSESADLIGLTQNPNPRPHIQSFFLAINRQLLHAKLFGDVMRSIRNMPTKEDVIAQYETQFTRFLRSKGFRCEALFPNLARHGNPADDTIFNWAKLIQQGFPFIKASVLEVSRNTPEALRLVPERYLNSGANKLSHTAPAARNPSQ